MNETATDRVPLRVIAEKSKVSRMTVSRALRDDPSISRTTCQRIQKLAKQLGYRPDPELGRLMETIRLKRQGGLPNVIAWLTTHDKRSGWREDHTMRICFDSAAQQAASNGYKLQEFWAKEPGITDKRLSEIIRARGISGVIVAPLPSPQLVFQDFEWDWFSAVEIGYSLASPPLHRVCGHHFESMLLLTQKLYESGYRRVGMAMKLQDDQRGHHHWRGSHLAAQSLWTGSVEPGLLFLPNDWHYDAFAQWLRKNRPDAIVAFGPQVGTWLEKLGLQVPADIGLANVDVRMDGDATTGIDRNPRLVGAAAIDLLISLIRNNERGVPAVPRVTKVQGTFVQGVTTKTAVASRAKSKALNHR